VIVGQQKAIGLAVRQVKSQQRYTSLNQRLVRTAQAFEQDSLIVAPTATANPTPAKSDGNTTLKVQSEKILAIT